MGDYSILRVADNDIMYWKWATPGQEDHFLNFIFSPNNKKVYEVKYGDNIGDVSNETIFSCCYEATVLEVKNRFDSFHFTVPEIERTISRLANIPITKVGLALMDYDEFFDIFDELREKAEQGDDNEAQSEWECLEDDKDNLDQKIAMCDLGYLPLLRQIRTVLDNNNNSELVKLDMEEVLHESSPNDFDEFKLVDDVFNTQIEMNQSYFELAKVHFTEFHFDSVYIELIIALENATKSYFKRKHKELSKSKKTPINLEKFVKDLSLMNLIKFVLVFVGNVKLDSSLIAEVEKTYNKRNNIIHNKAAKFKIADVARSIEAIEEMLNIIDQLK